MDRVRNAVVRAWDWERLNLDEWIDARHVVMVARRESLLIVQANRAAREFFRGNPVRLTVSRIKPEVGPNYWLRFAAAIRQPEGFSVASADYKTLDGLRCSGRLHVRLTPCARYCVAQIWPITQPALLQ